MAAGGHHDWLQASMMTGFFSKRRSEPLARGKNRIKNSGKSMSNAV
jgi:hypothetical protein